MKLLPRNLVCQTYSNQLAVGIIGDKETIEQTGNLLYNFNFTSSHPIYLSDAFAYCLVKKEDLVKGLINYFYCYLDNAQPRRKLKEIAKRAANNFISKIKHEGFILNMHQLPVYVSTDHKVVTYLDFYDYSRDNC